MFIQNKITLWSPGLSHQIQLHNPSNLLYPCVLQSIVHSSLTKTINLSTYLIYCFIYQHANIPPLDLLYCPLLFLSFALSPSLLYFSPKTTLCPCHTHTHTHTRTLQFQSVKNVPALK